MTLFCGRLISFGSAALLAAALAGCANTKRQAPVEDRGNTRAASKPASSADGGKPAAPVEAAPGTYIVKAGDTLTRIGLETGQSARDLARWNNLDNPNLIEVGQVLRVLPPGVEPGVATTKPVTSAKVETKPLDSRPAAAAAPAPAASAAAPAPAPAVAAATPPAPAVKEADENVPWAWPAAGKVIAGFDDKGSNKGLSISGKAGDPVLAAADGRVIYADSGLRGYGNLIIVKHNATYLTAYAHNQALLVKEDQVVRRGQKIAEMGSSDSDKVQLHFEIRRLGKPMDPAKLLPAR